MSDVGSILTALLLSGLLGMLGQGARTIVGLKKMNDDAAKQGADSTDLFIAARLVIGLMIGFIAGIAAGLALGLDAITKIGTGSIDLLLGIAAAGYAGTDFVESFLPTIIKKAPPVGAPPIAPQPPPPPQPAVAALVAPAAPPAPTGVANVKYGVVFGSLVPGGFFSADPDNINIHRSIRTNNPGALNFSIWQKTRPGYVAVTQPDDSPDHNVTTIYRSPEHGVAAWYYLLAVRYSFPGGVFTLQDLAVRYAGGAGNQAAVQAYINGWNRWYSPPQAPTAQISISDAAGMLVLAKAMFSHEAGVSTPVHDDQIAFALAGEMSGTLPA